MSGRDVLLIGGPLNGQIAKSLNTRYAEVPVPGGSFTYECHKWQSPLNNKLYWVAVQRGISFPPLNEVQWAVARSNHKPIAE